MGTLILNTQSAVMSLIYNETLGAVTPDTSRRSESGSIMPKFVWSGMYFSRVLSRATALVPGWLLAMKFVGPDLTDSQVRKH